MPIKEVTNSGNERSQWSFSQFRQRLIQILLSALQVENDSFNTHMLLGGLANVIHDLASFEQSEHSLGLQPAHQDLTTGPSQSDSTSNIISSTSDTHSCHSTSSTSYPSLSEATLESHYDHDTSFTGSSYNAPTPTFPLCES